LQRLEGRGGGDVDQLDKRRQDVHVSDEPSSIAAIVWRADL
jgi:hypothetical protein